MKNKKYKMKIVALLSALLIINTSCESWLDVQPKSEVKSDVLFETENGFKDALMGVYALMGASGAYGLDMTLGLTSVIGQEYDVAPTATNYYDLSLYRYGESVPQAKIDNTWATMYNVIANINNILDNLEKKKAILHPTNYAIIKGECLGLRAFLHFDLLRLWGYGDLQKHPENKDLLTIPYVKTYSKNITPQSTIANVLIYIQEDLQGARELLTYYDPFGVTPKDEDYSLPNEDQFYTNRKKRFNYFAVQALQARVSLWTGDYTQSLVCAREIINQEATFRWIEEANITSTLPFQRDLTFTTEHIFGLNVFDLYKGIKNYILPGVSFNSFYLTRAHGDEVYELADGTGASDYRKMYLTDVADNKYYFLKFSNPEDYAYPNNMPLIKKPEMFYIAAECLNHSGDADGRKEAIALLNEVRVHRGIVGQLSQNLDQNAVNNEIYKEYRKEFVSEGQMFFYYKRLVFNVIPNTLKPANQQVYVIPFPDIEIEFGGRK